MYVCPLWVTYSRWILEKIQQRILSTSFQYLILHCLQNMRGPKTIPRPKTNPNSTLKKFQSIKQANLSHSCCGCSSPCPLPFGVSGSGGPYSPSFPSKEEAANDWSWVPVGIFPTKWLKERFKNDRKLRLERSVGISPSSELFDRSKDSSCFRFHMEDEIWPVSSLFDKLST